MFLRVRALHWFGLTLILIIYTVSIARRTPAVYFGLYHDDSIYFSSAKALAEGKGYILPSLPGTPAATKYPVLYPWILSWVWRWNPSFPENLASAVAVTVAFGIWFVTATFLFLRGLAGIGDAEALFLTALCAFHPLVLFHSASVLSEIPFSALALTAVLIADRAMRRSAGNPVVVGCAILVGLSLLVRVMGVPIAAGIAVSAVWRRTWRQLIVFCGCVGPCFAALAWRVIFPHAPTPPVSEPAASSFGWVRTWTYYTNYLGFWRLSVPSLQVLGAMLKNNALMLLRGPSDYFLDPLLVRDTLMGRALMTLVTAAILAGIVRQARRQEWKPIHFALPFYLGVLLLWNYPFGDRFLLPFLPLFVAGLWIEGEFLLGMARATIVKHRPMTEQILAAALGVGVAALSFGMVLNYVGGMRRSIDDKMKDRAALLQEKRESYDWLIRSTAPDVRVIAYEDVTVFLYTGRTAIRPTMFTTAEFYDPARLQVSLAHLTDVAKAVEGDYWLTSDDDFDVDWPDATRRATNRMTEIEHVLPRVFRSREGRVSIYSLQCVRHPDDPSCQLADHVLFSSDDWNLNP